MYKQFYNLEQNPFQLTSNLDFFFESTGHKRAKAYLRYGLKQGEGFVVVTGVPGTGKTMLVKELVQSLKQDDSIVIGLMVSSHLGAEDTLRTFASIFGLPNESDNKAELLAQIKSFLYDHAQLGKRVLLVVDEAQNLPKQSIEELRMLSNFDREGKPILQIFLLGQEELGQHIHSPHMEQLQQRIVAIYHLRAIKETEISQYIYFRLSKAGWVNTPQFSADVFPLIYQFTQGIPRRINTLCDRLLLYGYLEGLSEINLISTKQVISEIEEDFTPIKESPNEVVPKTEGISTLGMEERIDQLEKKVETLSSVLNKERALLRKAILIQLDIDSSFTIDD